MPAAMNLSLPDAAGTQALGAALADVIDARVLTVLYLRGELGAGKTTLARSLLHSLGVSSRVKSPTYTLIENYAAGAIKAVHLDLYRLHSGAEVEELGLRDQLDPGTLVLIEWPERGGDELPPADLVLALSYHEVGRLAHLSPAGAGGEALLAKLLHDARLTPYLINKA